MRLYYVHEAESRSHHVRSALGVDAEVWNELNRRVKSWRTGLRDRFGIPSDVRLHPHELLVGRIAHGDRRRVCSRMLFPAEGVQILAEGLQVIENTAREVGGIEVINVCLYRPEFRDHRRVGLNRLFNRINTSAAAVNRHAILVFAHGEETLVSRTYLKMRRFNPVPSRYEPGGNGRPIRNVPIDKVIGGPTFRSSGSDCLLQMAHLVTHALLLREEESKIPLWMPGGDAGDAFGVLDIALNRCASQKDPQGVVRG